MSISLNKIAQVLPGVLSPSGSALDLNGLMLTDSDYFPVGTVLSFGGKDEVGAYVGTASNEYTLSGWYFQGYKNASRTPGALLFCRYNQSAVGAWLRSASLKSMTLAQLKALSGTLTMTINGATVTTATINLSSVTSFAQAAATLQTALNGLSSSVSVTVVFDTTTNAFIIENVNTGATSTTSYATGTLASGLKLNAASGAVLSQGAAAVTSVDDFFTTVLGQNQNWYSFGTAFIPTQDEASAFGAWVNGKNNRFAYVLCDNTGFPLIAGSSDALAYPIIQAAESAVIPVNGDQNQAAAQMGNIASLNFNQLNGRRTMAFRINTGLPVTATTNAEYEALIANGYNFYGNYAANATVTSQWYPGSITGDYKWIDAHAGQVWLNSNLQSDIITLFQSEIYLPYGTAGRSAIEASLTSTIEQFKAWGGITPGIALDDNQVISIKNATGSDPTNALNSKGYIIYIGPFTAQMRAERTSPEVYLWYNDGGFIQKLTLNSIAVQ